MKIGIEARMLGAENTRGLGRYIQELVTAMLEIAPEHEYTLVTRRADHALASHPGIRTVVADIPWYTPREQWEMPAVLYSLKADVIHIPHWNVPMGYGGPLVATIHDLILMHQSASANASTRPWPVRAFKRLGYRLTLRHAVTTAKKICVPTEFVKRDMLSFFPKTSSKIVVTGEGISDLNSKFKIHLRPELRSRENSKSFDGSDVDRGPWNVDRFLLYVGSAYPHKRLDLLLDGWDELSKTYPDMRLVVAGEMDAFMERTKRYAEDKKLSGVTFLGRVSDQDLSGLYQNALAFVFPSSFEGFGLPPLEALDHGCPVVSSDAACMPEVLGKNGVVYFKSGSHDGIIQAIKTVVDNSVRFKQKVLDAQPELRARHSWKKAASLTLKALTS